MISSQSYLIRAIYDWVLDCRHTPYIMVDASQAGVDVPKAYVRDHKIILNINPSAIDGFRITPEKLVFSARFSGQSFDISIPIKAVKAIYGKETESGMMFNDEGMGVMFSQARETASPTDPVPPDDEPPKSGKKPSLRVVK